VSPTGKDRAVNRGELLRLITSDKHTASTMAGGVVSTGRVAGNVADHSCRGCFAGLLGLPSNIGIRYARDLSIVKNIQHGMGNASMDTRQAVENRAEINRCKN
jgi:hypothetical protein